MKTKTERLVSVLKRRWISALDSALMGLPISLSQRVGELRRDGVKVIDRWKVMPSGARCKEYRILGGKGC